MIKNNYKKIWKYLKECKLHILIILTLFIISLVIGFLFPVFFVDLINDLIQKLMQQTQNMGFFELLIFIFKNNLTASFSGMIFGALLGIYPVFVTLLNGYVIGFVSSMAVSKQGYLTLLSLLPHGIFELPALILSLGLGLKLASFIFKKNKKKQILYDLENSLRVFIFLILPLLVVAAIIETILIIFLG